MTFIIPSFITLTVPLLCLLKIFLIGVLHLLEYRFFNKEIFEEFYFPYMVPNMKKGYFAAFVSGIKSVYTIYLALSFIYLLPIFNDFKFYLYINLFIFVYLLYTMIKDKIFDKKFDTYKYHHIFNNLDPIMEIIYMMIEICISIYYVVNTYL